MEQLSLLDFSTDINDHLLDVKLEDITVSKKLSKSINSKGFYIVLHQKKRLCYVRINKFSEFVGLSIRAADDRTGMYIPCSQYDVSRLLKEAFNIFINSDGEGSLSGLR